MCWRATTAGSVPRLAYLERRGIPADPRDLLQHDCLCVRENNEDVTLWRHRRGSRAGAVRVTPTLTSNDGEVVRNWSLAGLGIMLRSQWDAAPFVKRGELRRAGAVVFRGADILALDAGATRHFRPALHPSSTSLKSSLKSRPPGR